jgi:hypothetical protein
MLFRKSPNVRAKLPSRFSLSEGLGVVALKRGGEFFRCDASLPQHASQRADLEFRMSGDDASAVLTAHEDVAPGLPDLGEPESLQSTDCFTARCLRQPRHALVLAP